MVTGAKDFSCVAGQPENLQPGKIGSEDCRACRGDFMQFLIDGVISPKSRPIAFGRRIGALGDQKEPTEIARTFHG